MIEGENKLKDIVIIGCGGFGREVAWLIEDINLNRKEWNILGFIDEDVNLKSKEVNGYKVLGGFDFFYNKKGIYYACAIGNALMRENIVKNKCSKYDIKPAVLIHPSVLMNKSLNKIGEGSIICASNIITVNINIGRHSIINLDCTIGHDSILGDFSTIYPSVNISGNCKIGEGCEIGTGAQIIQGKEIGKNTIVGAGAVVINNIQSCSVAVGSPAKVIKKVNI